MSNINEHRVNFIASTGFFIVLLLMVSAFSKQSSNQNNESKHFALALVFHSDMQKAVVFKTVVVPCIENGLLYILDKGHINIDNETLKLKRFNQLVFERFISLHKFELFRQQVFNCRFYYHYFSQEKKDIPILS